MYAEVYFIVLNWNYCKRYTLNTIYCIERLLLYRDHIIILIVIIKQILGIILRIVHCAIKKYLK